LDEALLFIARERAGLAGPVFGEGFFRKPVELACLDIVIDLAVPCVVEIDLSESSEELVLVFFAQFAHGGEYFGDAHRDIFGGK